MKKYIIILTFLIINTTNVIAQNNKQEFVLNGKITGRDTGFVWLKYWDDNGKEIRDTTYLKQGLFSFKGFVKEPTQVILTGNVKGKFIDANDPNQTEIFVEPGKMYISLVQDQFKKAKVTGSVSQNQMDMLTARKATNTEKLEVLSTSYNQVDQQLSKADSLNKIKLRAQLNKIVLSFNEYLERQKEIDYAFILEFPNSYVSPVLTRDYFLMKELTIDSAKMFYNSFTARIKNSRMGKILATTIKEREDAAAGKIAYPFSRIDHQGKKINLSEYKGKYILLDFWASWCVPCREFTPKLKTLYNQYHAGGLEIISISSDVDKVNWLSAIKQDQSSIWPQVLAYENLPETMGKETANNLFKKYNVRAIPVLILIDKEGSIIGRYFGDSETGSEKKLLAKLEVLFKQSKL